jgi:hypothetical protein
LLKLECAEGSQKNANKATASYGKFSTNAKRPTYRIHRAQRISKWGDSFWQLPAETSVPKN